MAAKHNENRRIEKRMYKVSGWFGKRAVTALLIAGMTLGTLPATAFAEEMALVEPEPEVAALVEQDAMESDAAVEAPNDVVEDGQANEAAEIAPETEEIVALEALPETEEEEAAALQVQSANDAPAKRATDDVTTRSNDTMYRARILKRGKGVIDTFVDQDCETNSWDPCAWYKYKAQYKLSLIKVKLESIDGREIVAKLKNADGGNWKDRYSETSIYTSSTGTYWTKEHGKGDLLYISLSRRDARLGDQFKLTVTEYPILKTVSTPSVSSVGRTSAKVSWCKRVNSTKYQLAYRVRSGKKWGGWKYKTVSSTSYKLNNLKRNSKIQVRVRSYCKGGYNENVDKVSNYGAWSKIRTFNTKK